MFSISCFRTCLSDKNSECLFSLCGGEQLQQPQAAELQYKPPISTPEYTNPTVKSIMKIDTKNSGLLNEYYAYYIQSSKYCNGGIFSNSEC